MRLLVSASRFEESNIAADNCDECTISNNVEDSTSRTRLFQTMIFHFMMWDIDVEHGNKKAAGTGPCGFFALVSA
jgi:hypothetical protein